MDMKIVDPYLGDITNLEVLNILKKNKERNLESRKGMTKELHNSFTIEEQVIKYLNKTAIDGEDLETMTQILEKLKDKNYTRKDKLQILNILPQTEVEPYLILEPNTLKNLQEDQITQLLQDVAGCLKKTQPE